MRKAALLLFAGMLGFGQAKVEKSAFDKATLEAYLRTVELFTPTVTAKIDDAKPSAELPGFLRRVGPLVGQRGDQGRDWYTCPKTANILSRSSREVFSTSTAARSRRTSQSSRPTVSRASGRRKRR